MKTTTVVRELASLCQAYRNCVESGNQEWELNHRDRIEDLSKRFLPSGSGFDMGCTVDLDESDRRKLVISAPFHHMDEHGYYAGWSDTTVTVTPTFCGIDADAESDFSGVDDEVYVDDHGDYVCETLHYHLTREICVLDDGSYDWQRDENGQIAY